MLIGINLVKTMRQHRHRFVTIVQSLLVGTDVHAIGQATDHQHLRTHLLEISHEHTNQVPGIHRTLTGAYDIHNLRLVQVGIATVINDKGGVWTLTKPSGVVIIHRCHGPNLVILHELQFKFRPFHRLIPVFHGFDKTRRTSLNQITDLIPMFINTLCTAHSSIQLQRLLEVKIRQARQRHRIKKFLFHNITFHFY